MIDPAVYWSCFGAFVVLLVLAATWKLIGGVVLHSLLIFASAALLALVVLSLQRQTSTAHPAAPDSPPPVAIGRGSSKCCNHDLSRCSVRIAPAPSRRRSSHHPHLPAVLLATAGGRCG